MILTSWGWVVPSSVKLEVIVEVVVKVSSWSRGHSVLLWVGGWEAGEVENIVEVEAENGNIGMSVNTAVGPMTYFKH